MLSVITPHLPVPSHTQLPGLEFWTPTICIRHSQTSTMVDVNVHIVYITLACFFSLCLSNCSLETIFFPFTWDYSCLEFHNSNLVVCQITNILSFYSLVRPDPTFERHLAALIAVHLPSRPIFRLGYHSFCLTWACLPISTIDKHRSSPKPTLTIPMNIKRRTTTLGLVPCR